MKITNVFPPHSETLSRLRCGCEGCAGYRARALQDDEAVWAALSNEQKNAFERYRAQAATRRRA